MAGPERQRAMDERQRCLFEVMGVLVVPGVVSPSALRELRAVLEAHNEAEPLAPDADGTQPGQNSFPRWRTSAGYEHCPQHLTDEHNMLHWSPEYRNVLTNPVLVPILEELLTPRFRLDHIYGQSARPPTEGLSPHCLLPTTAHCCP